MSDYILIDNDMVVFMPIFSVATVAIVGPAVIRGSGKPTLNGNKICIEGDEKKVSILGCPYITPTYPIPGIGTIKIKSLSDNHKTKLLTADGKAVLLKGGEFDAVFSVTVPAQTVVPTSKTDETAEYNGYGRFITKNLKWKSL